MKYTHHSISLVKSKNSLRLELRKLRFRIFASIVSKERYRRFECSIFFLSPLYTQNDERMLYKFLYYGYSSVYDTVNIQHRKRRRKIHPNSRLRHIFHSAIRRMNAFQSSACFENFFFFASKPIFRFMLF